MSYNGITHKLGKAKNGTSIMERGITEPTITWNRSKQEWAITINLRYKTAISNETGLGYTRLCYNHVWDSALSDWAIYQETGMSYNRMSYNRMSYNGMSYNGLPYNGLSNIIIFHDTLYSSLSAIYTYIQPGGHIRAISTWFIWWPRPPFAYSQSHYSFLGEDTTRQSCSHQK